ncbi:MAG TPA: prolyl oligopeptidase family serine peptidase [Candidatus Acidoferrales bacterium]|nr:prolyl oligopeptidase family serine peptidase [Candidatus Acidoferrales bacterium]
MTPIARRCFIARVLAVASLLAFTLLAVAPGIFAQSTYQKPSTDILKVLLAPAPPMAFVNPQGDEILLAEPVRYPPIAELARPMLRIAGVRIDPANFGQHDPPRFIHLALVDVSTGRTRKIPFAYGQGFGRPEWAPDGRHFFLTVTADKIVGLWIGDAATGTIRRLPGIALNTTLIPPFAFGQAPPQPCSWAPGSRELLCRTVPANPGVPPAEPRVPEGPIVRQSFGKAAPAPTFEDMLTSPFDEQLFDYYAKSQLAFVNVATGKATPVGAPAIFESNDLAPNGHLILVSRIHHPYSYVRPFENFAHTVEVWDRTGRAIYKLADLPLQETIPIGGVATGPRDYQWQPSAPATLVWAEALDGGNPREKADYRDKLMQLSAPFTAQPAELTRTEFRFTRIFWGERGDLSILYEIDRAHARERTWFLNPQDTSAKPRLVWDMNELERYKNPGLPLMHMLSNGNVAVIQQGDNIFLAGQGASPEGDRPFLDRFNTQSLQAERLFHCDDKSYEEVVALASPDGSKFITQHETRTDPPNYFLRTAGENAPRALSHYADPNPQLLSIHKELVTYKRADGVPLSMTVYLPLDYKQRKRYPAVIWAYPVEFSNAGVAGEVNGSPNRFTEFTGLSPLWFLLDGYVVLDGPTMPVIGPPRTANDTYVEQIVASAKAAIDKAADMGIVDPARVGVGGHSYGAFMTANLLAHSELFRAGVARSGAYNRTLTPFGFQNERRSFWEAPQVYFKMSPFMFANQFHAPILLIHGMADNNSGTFPIQSQRMYMALKGNGASVRYVQLPDEAHGYQARESIEDVIWEMLRWFDLYVKPAAPAQQQPGQ